MRLLVLATISIASLLCRAEQSALVTNPVRTIAIWTALAYPAPYLAARCSQVINCGNGISDSAKCFANIGKMGTSAQMENSRAYMLDDLEKLGQDKSALRALRNIDKLAGEPRRKFNLWSVTLRSFNGDKRKSMKFLAAFFQAREFESDRLSPEINALKNSVLKKLITGMRKGDIEGYPPGIKPNKTGIYHFYAVGEIAAKMRDAGVSTRYAAALPFSMNEGYEMVLNRSKNEKAYEDIYTGYAGVSFALSEDKDKFSGVDYEAFQQKYHSDGVPAVSRFLKNDLGGNEIFCNDFVPYKASSGTPIRIAPENSPAQGIR